MDDFHVRQLTKELVAENLRELPDPCKKAAELTGNTLRVALKGLRAIDQEALVREACQGAITALLIAEQNLARGAVMLLQTVADLAGEFDLDPAMLMTGALRGIADLRRFATPEQIMLVEREIESAFMGVGQAFRAVLEREAAKDPPRPGTAAPKEKDPYGPANR